MILISTRRIQFIILSVLCLFCISAQAAQINVFLNNQQTIIDIEPVIIEASQQDGLATFDISTDQSILSRTGQPAIPSQIIRLLLPPNSDLDSIDSELDATYSSLKGTWDVSPAPPVATRTETGEEIIVWPDSVAIVNGFDTDIYGANNFWPSVQPQLLNTGRVHNWKLAELAVPLYRYNSVTGELLELTEATLSVHTANKGNQQSTIKSNRNNAFKTKNKQRSKHVKDITANFVAASAAYEDLDTTIDRSEQSTLSLDEEAPASPNINDTGYVIITTNAIQIASSKLASFVTHKQSLGYMVNVITENQYGSGTGDTAAYNIRSWLQTNYNNSAYGNGGILYALLIGDPRTNSSSVPMKMCIGDHPTDYFYARTNR